MSTETDVQMKVLFTGQSEPNTYTLSAGDYARFEQEYAAWQKSGDTAREFQYLTNGKTTFLRFDQIIARETMTVADLNRQHRERLQAFIDVNQRD